MHMGFRDNEKHNSKSSFPSNFVHTQGNINTTNSLQSKIDTDVD